MTSSQVVALYARISLDRNDGEGVARQLADCHDLANQRWPDAEVSEYIDNDLSAFRARRRPEFDRLLTDLQAGRLAAVVAYHPDRLYRQLADLESFVVAVKTAGAEVATIKAGDVDVSTASGQMVAEILASVSKHEAARIGERVSRSKAERAAKGRPAGGGLRPFGLTRDRTALVASEADQIRRVAAAVLDGGSWYAEARRLNAEGVYSTAGNPWSVQTLRRSVCSHYIAGLRSYKGRVVADTVSPAILDRDTWDALQAIGAGRPGRRPSESYLLSAVLSCGECGRPLWMRRAKRVINYSCVRTAEGTGCGRIAISMPKADEYVCATVSGWLRDPDALAAYEAWLAGYDDPAVAAELAEVERQEIQATQRWAAGMLKDAQHDAALAVLAERRSRLEARSSGPRPRGLNVPSSKLAVLFDAATIPERRELIKVYAASPIPVGPGRVDGYIRSAGERIGLRPVWES